VNLGRSELGVCGMRDKLHDGTCLAKLQVESDVAKHTRHGVGETAASAWLVGSSSCPCAENRLYGGFEPDSWGL
jgi:hypothetical protein